MGVGSNDWQLPPPPTKRGGWGGGGQGQAACGCTSNLAFDWKYFTEIFPRRFINQFCAIVMFSFRWIDIHRSNFVKNTDQRSGLSMLAGTRGTLPDGDSPTRCPQAPSAGWSGRDTHGWRSCVGAGGSPPPAGSTACHAPCLSCRGPAAGSAGCCNTPQQQQRTEPSAQTGHDIVRRATRHYVASPLSGVTAWFYTTGGSI